MLIDGIVIYTLTVSSDENLLVQIMYRCKQHKTHSSLEGNDLSLNILIEQNIPLKSFPFAKSLLLLLLLFLLLLVVVKDSFNGTELVLY